MSLKVFQGNWDRNTVESRLLDPPIMARFVRVQPKTWYGHISMRLELYGCSKGLYIPKLFDWIIYIFKASYFSFKLVPFSRRPGSSFAVLYGKNHQPNYVSLDGMGCKARCDQWQATSSVGCWEDWGLVCKAQQFGAMASGAFWEGDETSTGLYTRPHGYEPMGEDV